MGYVAVGVVFIYLMGLVYVLVQELVEDGERELETRRFLHMTWRLYSDASQVQHYHIRNEVDIMGDGPEEESELERRLYHIHEDMQDFMAFSRQRMFQDIDATPVQEAFNKWMNAVKHEILERKEVEGMHGLMEGKQIESVPLLQAFLDVTQDRLQEEKTLLANLIKEHQDRLNEQQNWIFLSGMIQILLLFGLYQLMRRDLQCRRLAEKNLRLTTAIQKMILEAVGYAITATDEKGIIRIFNPEAEKLLGYKAEELEGFHTPDIFHDPQELREEAEKIKAQQGVAHLQEIKNLKGIDICLFACRQGERNERVWTYIRKDGSRVPVSLMITAIFGDDGECVGFVGIAKDISAQRELENELRNARDSAISSALLKSEFLATLSHEIRTPMNGIVGMTELLLGTDLDEKQKEFTEVISQSAESLLVIINDILDFSKLEAGMLQFEEIAFDLHQVLEGVLDLMTYRALMKGIELALFVGEGVPMKVLGDPVRLRQILVNLLSNAIKFTEKGEVVLSVHCTRKKEQEAHLRFRVRDTGIGMSQETMGKIFMPFVQADGSTTRKFGGTGLGLAITQRLLEGQGAGLVVESQLGVGSQFSFQLKFLSGETNGNEKMKKVFSDTRKKRVLVYKRHETNRMILGSYLSSYGFYVTETGDLEEALEYLKETEEGKEYVLFFLDVLESLEATARFLKTLKEMKLKSFPKTVLLSPMVLNVDWSIIQQMGFDDILSKPVKKSKLRTCLYQLIEGVEEVGDDDKEAGKSVFQPLEMNILMAEDNAVNAKVLKYQLEQMGCKVHWVKNGQEAFDEVFRNHYDMVLMDCHMPLLDGYEVTRKIRKKEERMGTRILITALTANASEEDEEECLQAGMDYYFSKPVKKEDLYHLLSMYHKRVEKPKEQPKGASKDLERVLSMYKGADAQLAEELVHLFEVESPRLLEAVKQGVKNREPLVVTTAIHNFRSGCAIIGADHLGALCLGLKEWTIHMESNVESPEAMEILEKICEEFERLRSGLREMLGEVAEN